MTPAPHVFIDFETRSRADLKAVGGRNYAEDASTEVLCAVAVVSDGTTCDAYAWSPWPGPVTAAWHVEAPARPNEAPRATRWHPAALGSDDPPEPVLAALRAGAPLVAHNAHGFDRHVWAGLGLPDPPGGWRDSLDRARRLGLPGGLEALALQVYGKGKDKLGRRLMLEHCAPHRVRGSDRLAFRDPGPAALSSILRYCALDAFLLCALWWDLRLGDPHVDDPVLQAHEEIDERGFPVDLALADRIARVDQILGLEALAAAEAHGVSSTLLRGAPALRIWLRDDCGVDLPDVTAPEVKRALAGPLPAKAREVLLARLAVARVTSGKLAALQARTSPDGRVRHALAYHAAHTGRWAGRGVQPHNFPRAADAAAVADQIVRLPEPQAVEVVRATSKALGVPPEDLLGSMLRSVVCAPEGRLLATADLSQIEARALLYMAHAGRQLEVYRRGIDAYAALAADVFGLPLEQISKDSPQRQVAKVLTLALGYSGGPGALTRYAEKTGVDLDAVGLSAEALVELWRDRHPEVAGLRTGKTLETDDGRAVVLRRGGLWKAWGRAAARAVSTAGEDATEGEGDAYRVRFSLRGVDLVVTLPSGRDLVYRDARIEEVPSKWTPGTFRRAVTYQSPRGARHALYGGLVTENVIQALCRDLLADALVRLEAAGLPVVLHVHDEVVVEIERPDQLDQVRAVMQTPPAWAQGLPVACSGGVARRWEK